MSEESEKQKAASKPGRPVDLEAAIRQKILRHDSRFALGAYVFIYESLAFTQKRLGLDDPSLDARSRHVSGQDLLKGICQYAAQLLGPLSPTVFRSWGVCKTEDFGEIVFNLVENDLLGKTDTDCREDFAGGFDFDTAFEGPVKVKLE